MSRAGGVETRKWCGMLSVLPSDQSSPTERVILNTAPSRWNAAGNLEGINCLIETGITYCGLLSFQTGT